MMTMSMVTRKNWSDDLGLASHPSSPYLRLQTFRPPISAIRSANTDPDDDDDHWIVIGCQPLLGDEKMKIDMKPMCKLKSYGSDDVATDDDGDFSRTMMIKQG